MEIRNKYERIRIRTCAGNKEEIEYELQVNERGIKEPVAVGKIDIRQEINSHRDSCDLNMLIARYNAGDYDALNKRAAMYFDSTEMPTTLADAYRIAENGKNVFNKLSPEIRERFGNDYGVFLNQIGSKSFVEAFYGKPVSEVKKNSGEPVSEVKENKDEQKSE